MKGRILICDDEKNILVLASAILKRAGYETEVCIDSRSMINELSRQEYDLVLTDMYLGNETGIAVFKKIKETLDIPFILFSASTEVKLSKEAFKSGFKDFLKKPFGAIDLATRVENVLKQHKQLNYIKSKNEEYNEELNMAAKLQKELSPNWIVKSGKIYSSYLMRGASQMSGDLFAIYELEKNKTLYIVGDVSGHGVSSSILSIGVRNYMSNLISNRGIACLSKFAEEVNRYVCSIYDGKLYMTMVFVLMDSISLEAEIISAGHKYIFRKNRAGFRNIGNLINSGIPLGWDEDAKYPDINILTLTKDDALFLCTDGISGTFIEEEKLFLFLKSEIDKATNLKNITIPFSISKNASSQKKVDDDLTAVLISPEESKLDLHNGVLNNINEVYSLAIEIKDKDIGRSLRSYGHQSFSLIVSEWASNLLKYVDDEFDKTIYFEINYDKEELVFYHQTPPYRLSKLTSPESCVESGRGGHIMNSLANHLIEECGSGLFKETFSLKRRDEICA